MAKVNLADLVITPRVMAGIKTVKCACGQEWMFITPEEEERFTRTVLYHLKEEHHLDLPAFTVIHH